MFGIRVDRTNRLWKPLNPRQRGVALGLSMLLIASVAFASFVNLLISGAATGTAGQATGISLDMSNSICTMLSAPGTCTMTPGANDASFNLALLGESNDSQIKVVTTAVNEAGGGTLCLQNLPTWVHGAITDHGVVDLLKSIPSPGARTMEMAFSFGNIVADQSLVANVTYTFGSAGCVP